MLVVTDPSQGVPEFLVKDSFTHTEVPIGRLHDKTVKCWYKNDIQGMKYFASSRVPGDAQLLADKLWFPPNWRYINCTDEAPDVVCAPLMGKSRMEYLVLPCPHVLSGFMTRGIQFDDREALVVTWRQKAASDRRETSRCAHVLDEVC